MEKLPETHEVTGKPAENENLGSMVIPTELPAANTLSQTDADVQGNLLREYEQKFAELPQRTLRKDNSS